MTTTKTKAPKKVAAKKIETPKVEDSKKDLNAKIKAKLEKNKTSEKIEKVNKAATLQQVITNRELKYKYPADVVDTLARKSFRQKTRNKIRQLERTLEKADKEQKAKAQKELEAFRKEVLIDIKAAV